MPMKLPKDSQPVFLWRSIQRNSVTEGGHLLSWRKVTCDWCQTVLQDISHTSDAGWAEDSEQRCSFCGWWHRQLTTHYDEHNPHGDQYYFWSELRAFPISDHRITFAELGTHLRRSYADVFSISPRRFEELIEDVFKQHGYRTRLTAASRDDGVDIYFLDLDGEPKAIVEVKRYAQNRKVGLGLVDRLIGVQLRKGVSKAIMVTSSTFTTPAQSASVAVTSQGQYALDLIDAQGVLQLLGVYNAALPPLSVVLGKWNADG